MFAKLPERIMLWVRGGLASLWLIMIVCLLTDPLGSSTLAIRIFWTLIACAPLFLMVFGHEAWRRICPLSFFSQIPRMLGLRRLREVNGTVGVQLPAKDSWLARNHLKIQFGILTAGVWARAVFLNSDRIALACFLLMIITAAMTVGWRFGGKSWCNYFCPISPVQKFYSSPGGLLESKAHSGELILPKSVCRTASPGGPDRSACEGCKMHCPDIDLELNYWQEINKPGQTLIYFGYPALILAFYLFHWFDLGELWMVLGGDWAARSKLANALELTSEAPLPRLIASAAIFAAVIGFSVALLGGVEKWWRSVRAARGASEIQARHELYALLVWASIIAFYTLGRASFAWWLPRGLVIVLGYALCCIATLWLVASLRRGFGRYTREALATKLRQQLEQAGMNQSLAMQKALDGKKVRELSDDEVYILGRTIPSLSGENKLGAYRELFRSISALSGEAASPRMLQLPEVRKALPLSEAELRGVEQALAEEAAQGSRVHLQLEDRLRTASFRRAVLCLHARWIEEGALPVGDRKRAERERELLHLRASFQVQSADIEAWRKELLQDRETAFGAIRAARQEIDKLAAISNGLQTASPDRGSAAEVGMAAYLHAQERRHVLDALNGIAKLGNDEESRAAAEWLTNRCGARVLQALAELEPAPGWRLPRPIVEILERGAGGAAPNAGPRALPGQLGDFLSQAAHLAELPAVQRFANALLGSSNGCQRGPSEEGSLEWISTRLAIVNALPEPHPQPLREGEEIEVLWNHGRFTRRTTGTVKSIGVQDMWLHLKIEGYQRTGLQPGTMLTVFYRPGDGITTFSFFTVVKRRNMDRADLLLVNLAANPIPAARRRHLRVDTNLKATVRPAATSVLEQPAAKCLILSLGGGGAMICVEGGSPAAAGDLVELKTSLPNGRVIDARLEVTWSRPLTLVDARRECLFGGRFAEIDEIQREALIRFTHDEKLKAIETHGTAGPVPWKGFRKFVVERTNDEGGDVKSVYMRPLDGLGLPRFKSGQFLTFRYKIGPGGGMATRCYSLSDSKDLPHFRISVKKVPPPPGKPGTPAGLVSNFVHSFVTAGSILDVKAPSGHFHIDEADMRPLVLIGGGIGITPVMSMLNYTIRAGVEQEIWFFLGVRHSAEHIFKAHLEEMAKSCPRLRLHVCYSNPAEGDVLGRDYQHKGRVTADYICSQIPSLDCHYYLCGPGPFMSSLVEGLLGNGAKTEDVRYEAFGPSSIKAGGAVEKAVDVKTDASIKFAADGRQLKWDPGCKSLLEFAEKNGISLPFGCRVGNCHTCVVDVEEGEVSYIKQPDTLPEGGTCLTCIGVPKTDMTIVEPS